MSEIILVIVYLIRAMLSKMFDFEKLEVYNKARDYHRSIWQLVQECVPGQIERNQILRASLSKVLNIAEGAGRFTNPDKRNFYIIARGSVYECVVLLDVLLDKQLLSSGKHSERYALSEEISKMLYALIKKLSGE